MIESYNVENSKTQVDPIVGKAAQFIVESTRLYDTLFPSNGEEYKSWAAAVTAFFQLIQTPR